MKVRDILRRKRDEIISITAQVSLLEASRVLSEHNVGVLLVMDAQGKPIGIISERDIVRQFAQQGAHCAETPVKEAMTEELIVGVPDDDLNYVMNVMTQKRIRHLPILDEDRLAGLISIGDVVKAQVDQAETEIRYLTSYITGTRT